jgi:hypothetical protein
MEIAALKQDDFQVWVPFTDAEVLLRYVSLEELEKVRRKATASRWDRKGPKAESMDPLEANRLLGRAAVRGWRGITLEGEDYPYSEEHCDFLMTRWSEFAKFVSEAALDLRRLAEEERADRGNASGLTSGPGGTTRA